MGKDKLRRFALMQEFNNVFQPAVNHEFPMKGKWRSEYFKNDAPIVLELGCGKGEYTVGLAKHFPDKNFIGLDIKGARMFIGAQEALQQQMGNVAFLRTRIDFICDYFSENEIDEIWLTFSDPQPKKPRKRLSSPLFIERYKKILKPKGVIHMKTDSDLLFEYTEEQIKEHGYECLELTWDLYGSLPETIDAQTREIFHIKTHYEKLFTAKGSVIKYCRFKID
ncbi:MAG: tRNA (guanosine(46)-N7)-methyltransferase TrmB [Cryomorphaceae bacterium]|jgi:tRNA (guanine-N7-)-methyltransferase|nr:tRNA (guanosine(46)-N7)-methyltransferase TrmB [Cryomorphaceae bacterium]